MALEAIQRLNPRLRLDYSSILEWAAYWATLIFAVSIDAALYTPVDTGSPEKLELRERRGERVGSVTKVAQRLCMEKSLPWDVEGCASWRAMATKKRSEPGTHALDLNVPIGAKALTAKTLMVTKRPTHCIC